MREQEVRELYEAYLQVHQPQEEVEQLNEEAPERITKRTKNPRLMKDAGPARVYNPVKEEIDLFDTILEYLVAEGYADTNESALVIMANMSEGWKQSIVEGNQRNPERDEKTPKSDEPIPGQAARKMPKRGHPDREAFEKWYRTNVR